MEDVYDFCIKLQTQLLYRISSKPILFSGLAPQHNSRLVDIVVLETTSHGQHNLTSTKQSMQRILGQEEE